MLRNMMAFLVGVGIFIFIGGLILFLVKISWGDQALSEGTSLGRIMIFLFSIFIARLAFNYLREPKKEKTKISSKDISKRLAEKQIKK